LKQARDEAADIEDKLKQDHDQLANQVTREEVGGKPPRSKLRLSYRQLLASKSTPATSRALASASERALVYIKHWQSCCTTGTERKAKRKT
jgi:hypothetical protein